MHLTSFELHPFPFYGKVKKKKKDQSWMPWASQEVPVVKILAAMESSPWGRKEPETTEQTCAYLLKTWVP